MDKKNVLTKNKKLRLTRDLGGQTLVEFVLAFPFLLLCLVAIIYFGRLFYAKQALVYAAQEAARMAAKIPNLSDPTVRDAVRGFTLDGTLVGPDDLASNPSPVYTALSAARMLSSSDMAHGNLPPGASVKILPFDDLGAGANSSDAITVTIQYPFGLMMDWRTGQSSSDFGDSVKIATTANSSDAPISFDNLTITESASAAQEVYQE